MAWHDWENPQTRELWEQSLQSILNACQEFAQTKPADIGMQVSSRHADEPDVVLKWAAGGANRNLQVAVEGTAWPLKIRFSGAVWTDSPLGRAVRHLDFDTISVADAEHVGVATATNLPYAFNQIDSADAILKVRQQFAD